MEEVKVQAQLDCKEWMDKYELLRMDVDGLNLKIDEQKKELSKKQITKAPSKSLEVVEADSSESEQDET